MSRNRREHPDSKDSMSLFFPDRIEDDRLNNKQERHRGSETHQNSYHEDYHRHKTYQDMAGTGSSHRPYNSRGSSGKDLYRGSSSHQHSASASSSVHSTPHHQLKTRKEAEYKDSYTPIFRNQNGFHESKYSKESYSVSKFEKYTNIISSTSHENSAYLSKAEPKLYVYDSQYDDEYETQLHHMKFTSDLVNAPKVNKKNYKVMYDPEIKREEEKGNTIVYRINGEGVSEPKDPRKEVKGYPKHSKRSKKCLYKSLLIPKFLYDKDSIGPPPPVEVVIWGLPVDVSEVLISNSFKKFGEIKNVESINHPKSAVPLGIFKIKYEGSLDRASRAATLASSEGISIKINGSSIHLGLNDSSNKLLKDRISKAVDYIERQKQKNIEMMKKEKLIKKKAPPPEAPTGPKPKQVTLPVSEPKTKMSKSKPVVSSIFQKSDSSILPDIMKVVQDFSENESYDSKPNTSILSKRHKNKQVDGIFLPKELSKYIKNRPYIVIHDKYVPTRDISSTDVKKALDRYDWTRVLTDKTGFYVVFNSLKECERCFKNEDGRKFFEYKMYMELSIPEGYSESSGVSSKPDSLPSKPHDVVGEATNMLVKELQNFLAKDIRERVIAPVVLDLLNPDRYPQIVEELRSKEEVSKKLPGTVKTEQVSELGIVNVESSKINTLPSFRKKSAVLKELGPSNKGKNKKLVKKTIDMLPMQHALNFSDSEEEGDTETKSTTMSPALDFEPSEDTAQPPKMKLKRTTLRDSFMFNSSDDSDESDNDLNDKVGDQKEVLSKDDIEMKDNEIVVKYDDKGDEEMTLSEQIDYSKVESIYRPTTELLKPVYEDIPNLQLDLNGLQSLLKDDEDMELAKEMFKNIKPSSTIKNLDYWAWKQKDINLSNLSKEESAEISETLSPKLENPSGASRSEGYHKISDADKIEYLPHRRKIHKPIKTIQHDDDSNPHGSIQSSRVNRADNRRFAAAISAQKQMLGSETDILNLNALTKRKKPVSFARSAIHNWGLYALEHIAAKEMIIEYVGESLRQQVADNREKNYLKSGIGSSYLFRIDSNTVIDATKKGGIARFINHCCSPSCTAKIIKVEGKKRIVIYASRDIEANEELTYDYKFDRELNDEERIPCLCGAPTCKGFLN